MRTGIAAVAGLYPLLSEGTLPLSGEADVSAFAETASVLASSGVSVMQLRLKRAPDALRLATQRAIQAAVAGWHGLLVIDDRADLAAIAQRERGAHGPRIGLHLGQTDLPPAAARRVVGPEVLIGLSTHDLAQVEAAEHEPVDYLGFGPVFPTRTKENPDPVVGLELLAEAARRAARPVVAIGGIGAAQLPEVRQAGASAAAVVALLWPEGTVSPEVLGGRVRAAVEAWR
jgi:thiamine-phosphate pyrophosphorylase